MDSLLMTGGGWVFAAVAGAAVALLGWGAIAASGAFLNPVRRRLGALRTADSVLGEQASGPAESRFAWLQPKDPAQRDKIRRLLSQAGWRSRAAVGWFYAAKLVTTLALPAIVVVVAPVLLADKASKPVVFLFAAIALVVGMLLPEGFVQRRIAARRATLMEGFPDALDLLVACTEAGLSFNAALERVVEQMPASQPELAGELGLVNAEIRAGVDRNQALKNLSDRTGLEEIRGLVTLIAHSSRLGTGVAGTLRIYAEEFRDRRMQQAEEIAAKISTKLTFPLVFCLFPSFFLVSIGPAIIGVANVLAQR